MKRQVSFFQCVTIKVRNVAPGQKEFTDVALVVTDYYVLVCRNPNALVNLYCKHNPTFKTWMEKRDIKSCIEYIKGILVTYAEKPKNIGDYDLKYFLNTNTTRFSGNVQYTLYDTKKLSSLTF